MATTILVLAFMMFLRIGIPILVIMGLSYVAYHWLGEDKKSVQPQVTVRPVQQATTGARIGGPAPLAQVMYASTHCWDEHGCTEEAKAKCPAFAKPELPCWLAVQMKTGHLRDNCSDCNFYNDSTHDQPVARA